MLCTGAVKVTPAHSHIDYELSRRHDLPLVHIFDDDGRLINVPQHFLVIPDMFFLLIAVYFTLYHRDFRHLNQFTQFFANFSVVWS